MRRIAHVLLALALAAGAQAQLGGVLVLKDGRSIEAPQIKRTDTGFLLIYPHGEIPVPSGLVLKALTLDEPSATDLAAASEEDKEKMAKGLVFFEGKWVSRKQAETLAERRLKKRLADIEELKKHGEWVNRYQESTAHFAFEYTLPQEVAQDYMNFFEEYWKEFARRWKISQPAKLGKLKVCMYSNMEDFLRIGNVQRGVLGYFRFVAPLELNFFHDRRDPEFTRAVLWHEANHYLMHLYVQERVHNPGWLEEGLAEYFGGSSWDPEKRKMTPGLTQEGRLVNLQEAMDGKEFQKLEPLLKQPRIDALQYAWSWALCHMLFHTKKYESGFNAFINKIAKDKNLPKEPWPAGADFRWVKPDTQIDLLKKCLGVKDLAVLEQEWYDYIRSMEVKSARGYYRAAGDCERWERPIRASVYYKKAIELEPSYLPAYEGFARLLVEEDKSGEAREIIQKGLALDPFNATFHLLLARLEMKAGQKNQAERLCNLMMDVYPDDVGIRWESQMLLASR